MLNKSNPTDPFIKDVLKLTSKIRSEFRGTKGVIQFVRSESASLEIIKAYVKKHSSPQRIAELESSPN